DKKIRPLAILAGYSDGQTDRDRSDYCYFHLRYRHREDQAVWCRSTRTLRGSSTPSSRGDQTSDRDAYCLGRQRAPIVGKLHNQRAVSCGLKPTTVVKGGIVVADTGVVTPKRHLQMVVIVVFEQHTSQVHFKSLRISFTNHNFRENAGLIVDPGSEQ